MGEEKYDLRLIKQLKIAQSIMDGEYFPNLERQNTIASEIPEFRENMNWMLFTMALTQQNDFLSTTKIPSWRGFYMPRAERERRIENMINSYELSA